MVTKADIALSLNKNKRDPKRLKKPQKKKPLCFINKACSKIKDFGLCAAFNLQPEHVLSVADCINKTKL